MNTNKLYGVLLVIMSTVCAIAGYNAGNKSGYTKGWINGYEKAAIEQHELAAAELQKRMDRLDGIYGAHK